MSHFSSIRAARRAVAAATVVTSAVLVACDGSTGPDHGPPANFAKHDGDAQTGVAGAAVAQAPALRVTDAENRPVPDIEVTFAVASGGGSVQGAVVDTDADGIAIIERWTLGTLMGGNTLTASTDGVVRATFSATGTAGAPTALVKVAGDNQVAVQGTLVGVLPAVRVRDVNNNPVAGVAVTFAVTGGGGLVTGGAATSGVDGVATAGSWQLGNATQQVLAATAAGLTSVSFTATGRGCIPIGTIAIGQGQTGTLATTDCNSLGYYMDWWTFTTPAQSVVTFTQSSTAFDAFVELFASDLPVASADNLSETSTDAELRVIVGPGTYNVAPSTALQNITGGYSIAVAPAAEDVPGCAITFVTPGINTAQTLESTDCRTTGTNVYYLDPFAIVLRGGGQYTITMSSTFDTWLDLYDFAAGTLVASNDDAVGTNARIVFTPTANRLYIIEASSNLVTTSGSYTLQIEQTGGGAARPSADPLVPLALQRANGILVPWVNRRR